MLFAADRKMRRSYNRAFKPLPPEPKRRGRMRYAGWDERFNFAQLTAKGDFYPENNYIMRALYVRASKKMAALADAAGNFSLAASYRAEADKMATRIRSGAGGDTPGDEWWRPFGLHASAHAVNAGLVNETEAPLVFASRFNDSGKVMQCFVLKDAREVILHSNIFLVE